MNNEVALNNLKLAKEVLDGLGVKFFLSNGTALGYHRHGDFLGHDSDIDLGVYIEDWSPEIVSEFKNAGFEVYKVYGSLDWGLEYTFVKDDIHVDIFFYYTDEDVWHGIFNGEKRAKYIYKPINLVEVDFKGIKVLCPTEEYLNDEYGFDWFHPVKEWHWWYSPRNIRYE